MKRVVDFEPIVIPNLEYAPPNYTGILGVNCPVLIKRMQTAAELEEVLELQDTCLAWEELQDQTAVQRVSTPISRENFLEIIDRGFVLIALCDGEIIAYSPLDCADSTEPISHYAKLIPVADYQREELRPLKTINIAELQRVIVDRRNWAHYGIGRLLVKIQLAVVQLEFTNVQGVVLPLPLNGGDCDFGFERTKIITKNRAGQARRLYFKDLRRNI